jgi:hypothetical protein
VNAFERAIKAIEAAIARGRPAVKPPKPKRQAPVEIQPRKAKVPMAERRRRIKEGHARRNAPVEAPLPTPPPPALTPPEEQGPITPAFFVLEPAAPVPTSAPVPLARPSWADAFERAGPKPASAPATSSGRFRGSCKAVDADTGRTCKLLEHPEEPDRHRSERGPFFRVLPPNAKPRLHEVLDEAAQRSINDTTYAGASHVAGERLPTGTKRDSSSGALSKVIKRTRQAVTEVGGGEFVITISNRPPGPVAYLPDGRVVTPAGTILPSGELLDDVEGKP